MTASLPQQLVVALLVVVGSFFLLVGIVFLFLTVPTGAHLISRSAQKMGVPFYGEDADWPEEPEESRSD